MTKNTRPKIRIYTSNDEFIDREMNDDEFAQHQIDAAKWLAEKAEIEAKAQAKADAEAKLAKLGLTADDLRALGL